VRDGAAFVIRALVLVFHQTVQTVHGVANDVSAGAWSPVAPPTASHQSRRRARSMHRAVTAIVLSPMEIMSNIKYTANWCLFSISSTPLST